MTAAQAGDRELFAALFDRHRRELLLHCYRMLGSFHEAEDLLQETFEKAWRRVGRVDTSSSPRAWLYRIATNACLDALRRRGSRRVLPFDVMDPVRPAGPMPAAADELWLEPFPDRLLSDVDPGETVVQRETVELAFLAALQHLPPRQRAAFIARDVLGWSARATAVRLDRHTLLRVMAGTSTGMPAATAAWRAVIWPVPACSTWPMST